MLILLPPSETKAAGGAEAPLNLESLSFSSLNSIRQTIIEDLVALCADEDQALATLKLSAKLLPEVQANQQLWNAPTMEALDRYTGVLYDALAASTLSADARSRLAVGSALFGVVGGTDLIPHYRLSATSKVPTGAGELPTMRTRWGKAITETLTDPKLGMIFDFRSGGYQNLGKVAGAVTAKVVTPNGKTVSHFNKHHKGLLARALATSDQPAESIVDAVEVAQSAGLKAWSEGDVIVVEYEG